MVPLSFGDHLTELLFPGGTIRTLSVSLLAVAALAAGVLLSRNRPSETPQLDPDSGVEDAVRLEALRRAGI